MSRFDGRIEAATEGAELGEEELMRLLADHLPDPAARQRAIACYLAAADGWRDAGRSLRGAFAAGTGLTGRTPE